MDNEPLNPADTACNRDEWDGDPGEVCWSCHGDGGWHDCGEDTCPCLHPELDLNRVCDECDGSGVL